jgi:hypothetical protein
MENYSMYRFFKGEKSNPFDNKTESDRAKFWNCESTFEKDFKTKNTSDWYAFFKDHGMQTFFIDLLTENDHENLTDKTKKPVFEIWLIYLFQFKLYPEYGGENKEKKIYYSIDL